MISMVCFFCVIRVFLEYQKENFVFSLIFKCLHMNEFCYFKKYKKNSGIDKKGTMSLTEVECGMKHIHIAPP